jgi:hypothetical protein
LLAWATELPYGIKMKFEGLSEPAGPSAQNPSSIIRKSLGLLVLYLSEETVELPLLSYGKAGFGSKGALVSAPATPKSSQTLATAPELNVTVRLSADNGAGAIA